MEPAQRTRAWLVLPVLVIAGASLPPAASQEPEDLVPPVTTLELTSVVCDPDCVEVHDPPRGWFTDPVGVLAELRCVDDSVGCNVEYALDGGELFEARHHYAPVHVQGDGVHVLAFRAVDDWGNAEAWQEAVVRIDTQPPATAAALDGLAGNHGWFRSAVQVSFECADATSGCERVDHALVPCCDLVLAHSDPLVLEAPGIHTVLFQGFDHAGHAGAPGQVEVRIDTVAPAGRLDSLCQAASGNGWCHGPVAYVLAEAADAHSGLAPPSCRLGPAEAMCHGTAGAEGVTRFTALLEDHAGNQATLVRDLRVDSVPPAASVAVNPLTLGSFEVRWSVSDGTSGLKGPVVVEEQHQGGAWAKVCNSGVSGNARSGVCKRPLTAMPGELCYRVTIRDQAGHSTTTGGDACTLHL